MKVAKWGNSLAIRLPAEVVEALDLKEGEDIEIVGADYAGRILGVGRKLTRIELLQALKRFRGMRPDDYVFDRDEANAR